MTDKFKVGKSSKEDYIKFLKKADEFFEIMRESLRKKDGMQPDLMLFMLVSPLMMPY